MVVHRWPVVLVSLAIAFVLVLASALSSVNASDPIAAQGAGNALAYLPYIAKQYPPPTATPSATHWSGTTSRGHPVSFDVSLDGSQWTDFVVTTDFAAPNCGVSYEEITQGASGPSGITGGQFSYSVGVFSFTGRFDSATTASGTYSFNQFPRTYVFQGPPFVCVFYLTQSGSWTASRSAAVPTPTASLTNLATVTPTATNAPTPTGTQGAPTATPTNTLTPTATVTRTPMPAPVPGHWMGLTSRGQPMSFDVSAGSTQWISFTLSTDFSAPSCGSSGTLETTVPGPGNITNNQLSYTSNTYSFTGQFDTVTAASGTYAYNNYQIVIGLPYPPYVCIHYLIQSGTWTASTP